MLANWLQKQWLKPSIWHLLLIPLSWIFGCISTIRKALYEFGWLKSQALSVPVIVIGNIHVGGTGKTPLVIWLAEQLKRAGYQPGIISRGYGGNVKQVTQVFANSNAQEVGDEPVLIVKRTNCPMFVNANRVLAGQALLDAYPECDVILSDDGLQHYRLQRDFEIAVVNTAAMQNIKPRLLPAGSMREKLGRLQTVNAIVDSSASDNHIHMKGYAAPVFGMQLLGYTFKAVTGNQSERSASDFIGKPLVAIAGIGNPERFFNQLSGLGLQFEKKVFADHHAFTAEDLAQFSGRAILMTEKDAVKCHSLAIADAWYLPVTATVSALNELSLTALLLNKLKLIEHR